MKGEEKGGEGMGSLALDMMMSGFRKDLGRPKKDHLDGLAG